MRSFARRKSFRVGPLSAPCVFAAALAAQAPAPGPGRAPEDHAAIRGVTISVQTWGPEWGDPALDAELLELRELGANWIAVHPYASIRADGGVRPLGGALDPEAPPDWLLAPIERAHARGFAILVKPHLAYWGSPFRWRGEIAFEQAEARARFWSAYDDWIVSLARAVHGADAFCVGTELDRMLGEEARWRALVARVRAVFPGKLTYAANWDAFEDVPFWDALDAVGVQAYFPLVGEDGEAGSPGPSRAALLAGWERALEGLRAVHHRTGKPVVFTELGYDAWEGAAREPWRGGGGGHHGWGAAPVPGPTARRLQARLLGTALEVCQRERAWLRGAFLWKWFVGAPGRGDHAFHLDEPELRAAIGAAWR